MRPVWRGGTGAAMKLRCQIFGTRVLGTGKAAKFVPQRLTVLLSYWIVASVPLLRRDSGMENGNCSDGT